MKKNNILFLALIALVAVYSCKKSFLDEDPSISISVDKAITSQGDMLEAVAGMYRSMTTYYTFGRNYQVFGDLLSDNVYLSSSNSSRFVSQNNYSWTSESAEALALWRYTYYSILQANRIINSGITKTDGVNYLLGEAYQARALCYFYLVNWFGKQYSVDPSAEGIPLVTLSANITGPLVYPSRNTVKEAYQLINADLDSAYSLMATSTTLHTNSTNYFTKYSAKALQSRVYLFMGDYANAITAALDVINNAQYTLTSGKTAFLSYWNNPSGRTDKVESIFELNNSATANNGVEGLDYIYSKSGLGDLLVTDSLYNIYKTTDSRLSLIIDSTRSGKQAYYVNKYQNVTNTNRDEMKMLRLAEVYLNAAEAYARSGDATNGLKYLNILAENRDPSFGGYSGISGTSLIDTILKERQKELAFEGFRFLDLARTNVDFVRENMGAKAYSFYVNVLATDFRRLQPIPQTEINTNTNISQNSGY